MPARAGKRWRRISLAVSGGWNPNIALATHLGGKPRGRPKHRCFCLSIHPGPSRSPALPRDVRRWPRRWPTARDGGARGRSAPRIACGEADALSHRRRSCRGHPDVACRRLAARQGLRRSPERRHGQGHRRRGERGVSCGRTPEALHHARHGHRSGQDLEHQRPCHHGRTHRTGDRADWHDAGAAAVGAGRDRRLCRAASPESISSRPGSPPATTMPRSRARPLSRQDSGCARSGSAATARADWLQSVIREVTATRSAVGICDVSTLGKIALAGADVGCVSGSRLHQHLLALCRSARSATASCCARTAS